MNAKKLGCFGALLLALALAWINSPLLAGEKQSPEGKVATVNGVEISQKELEAAMRGFQAQMSKTGRFPNPSEQAQIRRQILDNLIAEELLYQESQRKGIKVDPQAINAQFEGMKKRFSSEEEFKSWLSSMDVSEASFRSRLERNLAIRELIDGQFGEKTTVSDEEIKAYYDSNRDSFKKPEQVKASHILIKVDAQANESQKADARKKLETVQGKLQKGEEFATLAKEYSEGPSRTNGGDLGYFGRGRMVKPFEDAAFALKPGEVSGIVETQFGYHLIKVTDKTAASTMSYDEIKTRLGQYLKQEKIRKEMGLYIETLKGNAKIEVYSQQDSK